MADFRGYYILNDHIYNLAHFDKIVRSSVPEQNDYRICFLHGTQEALYESFASEAERDQEWDKMKAKVKV